MGCRAGGTYSDRVSTASSRSPDDIDLRQVASTLRRAALPILLLTAAASAGTYLLSGHRAPTYQSVSSVIAVQDNVRNALINNTLVTAPPLPQGAVEEATHSRGVVTRITRIVARSGLPDELKRTIGTSLTRELGSQSFRRLTVRARLDQQQSGVYELRASAETPQAARVLADAAVQALLDWDLSRAQEGVKRARASLEGQLNDLTARIAQTPPGSVDAQSLIAARGQVLQNLSQVSVFERAASGTLSLVSEANEPTRPASPHPARDAALAGLLALIVGSGAALMTDALRRRVKEPGDLMALGVPVVGQLPKLTREQLRRGIIENARAGALYESIGFARVNLMGLMREKTGGAAHVFAISSTSPGNGKSSVTAALAKSLSQADLRVLIVDLDSYRPTQQRLWSRPMVHWKPLPGAFRDAAAPSTLASALQRPELATALEVDDGIDLLPAADGSRRADLTMPVMHPRLHALLHQWAAGYDVVLLDTTPMLSVSDTLAVAPATDGIVMVVESERTPIADLERVLQNARVAGAPIVGFVLNKSARLRSDYGYYSLPLTDLAHPRG